jgi:hypothetical protein
MGDVIRRVVEGEPTEVSPDAWANQAARTHFVEPDWKSGVKSGSHDGLSIVLLKARSVTEAGLLVEVSICDSPGRRTVEVAVAVRPETASATSNVDGRTLLEALLGDVPQLVVVDDYLAASLSGSAMSGAECSPGRIADFLTLPGAALAIVVEGRRDGSQIAERLVRETMGIAAVARLAPEAATEVVKQLGLGRISCSDGGVVALCRSNGVIDAEAIGSFSVMQQPDSAAARIRGRSLRAQSSVRLGDSDLAAIAHVDAISADDDAGFWGELTDDLEARNNELRLSNDELEMALELAHLEHSEAAQENDDLRREAAYLRARLRELGEYAVVLDEDDVEPDLVVAGCLEALAAAHELDNLWIGAAEQPAEMLDRDGKRSVWGKKAWQSFKALNRYAAAKSRGDFTGNLLSFCDDDLWSGLPSTWVALNESDSTGENPRTRSMREFAVPSTVSRVGTVYMEAHIKLGMRDSQAPRIHFYDDTGGPSGRVLVGYFGPHLDTGG